MIVGFEFPSRQLTTKSHNQAEEKVEDRQRGIDSIQREQGALDTNVSNKMGDQGVGRLEHKRESKERDRESSHKSRRRRLRYTK